MQWKVCHKTKMKKRDKKITNVTNRKKEREEIMNVTRPEHPLRRDFQ